MKSGFILMLFAIGTLVCATYAAPASSEIQEENDRKKVNELLDLIDQAAKSQQDDGDENEESIEAQRFRRRFKGFWRKHRRGILKGAGHFAGGLLSGYKAAKSQERLTKQQNGDNDVDNLAESDSINKEQAMDENDIEHDLEQIAELQQDGESAEAQFFGKIFRGIKRLFGGGGHGGYGGGGYKAVIEQQEGDGDNLAESESMNAKEALELLKDIAKLQQENDVDDNESALSEIEQLPLDNMGEKAKEEEEDGEDEGDAEVQRRWRRRRRRRRGWKRRRGRGRGWRRGRGRRRGRGWGSLLGGVGSLIGGGLGGMGGGYPPQQPGMGGGYIQGYFD